MDNVFMSEILASDALLIAALFLSIVLLAYRARMSLISSLLAQFHSPTHKRNQGPLSLPVALDSFASYWILSHAELARMRTAYGRLPYTSRKIGYDIGYPQKLKKLEQCISLNSVLTSAISEFGRRHYGETALGWTLSGSRDSNDLGRVREALKHFVRDWSEESKIERNKTLQPVLDVLRLDQPEEKRVFVPGCGLGRLAWEISQLGYDTTALDFSSFMTLSLQFLLSPTTTTKPNQHILHPYSHWFSHQRSTDPLFRQITFPDIIPRTQEGKFKLLEGDFLLHEPTSNDQRYDYVVTLFFIDTSLDVFATISHIRKLLKPGGAWINLGPLLWTGGGVTGGELSLEEVLDVVRRTGMEICEDEEGPCRQRTIDCEYTADKHALMSWVYHAQFWVARRLD